MRIPKWAILSGVLCVLADAVFGAIVTLPGGVQIAELATIATIATILGGLSSAASPFLTPDPAKSVGGGGGAGQLGQMGWQTPNLTASQGTGATMQNYLTQLAGAQRGGASPSMRQRPRAAVPLPAAGAQPPGVGAGVQGGMPGMSDMSGMLQALYKSMATGG